MAPSITSAVGGACRAAAREAFRSFGIATSGMRPLPDFLIIGAHRAGTTSLHDALLRHPCVVPNFPRLQHIKGVRFFDENFHRGTDWYRSHFASETTRKWLARLRGAPVLAGEASPYYLFHPLAAERASTVVPAAKLIVLLRNPIARAHSHWRRERRDGKEPLETFEEAVAAERDRLAGEVKRMVEDDRYYSYAHENFSYISQGLYYEGLQRWLARYPREQIYIQSSEQFLADPQAVYGAVLRFLELPAVALPPPVLVNTTPITTPINPQTRLDLTARIAPHNRRLQELLGIDFGWDNHDHTDSLHIGTCVAQAGGGHAARSSRREHVPDKPVAYAAGGGGRND